MPVADDGNGGCWWGGRLLAKDMELAMEACVGAVDGGMVCEVVKGDEWLAGPPGSVVVVVD